jgi:hemolysin III
VTVRRIQGDPVNETAVEETEPASEREWLTDDGLPKPRWRGRLHQIACIASVPAGALLIAFSRHASAYVAASIYTASLIVLFGTSAAYHRGRWTAKIRQRMQRLDHGMIFVLIAGTYTPVTLLALHGATSIVFLILAWACAAAGGVLALVRFDLLDRYDGWFYVGFGWLLVLVLPTIVHTLSTVELILLFGGGLLYTVGAIGFRLERPRARPLVFGYHEIFHSMTIAAAVCHYALVFELVRS